MAPGWAGFLALTGVLLTVMLVLARVSQRALERPPGVPAPGTAQRSGPQPEVERPVSLGVEDGPDYTTGPETDDEPASERDGTPGSSGETADPRREFDLESLSPAALLANVALTHGLFASLLVGGVVYFAIPATTFGVDPAPAGPLARSLAIGLAFGTVLWAANETGARLADAIGVGYDETLRQRLAPDSLGGWALLLGVVLPIIAVGEELLFRGALIGVPAAGFGVSPWALAVVSSVAFALGHGAQGRAGVVVTGLLGFVLAAGFVLTGSLLVVIVAHYVVNALEFLLHEGFESDPVSAFEGP